MIENLSTHNEHNRLSTINRYKILDTPAEIAFNNLAALAAEIFELPISVISFTGKDEVFYKATVGLPGRNSEPRSSSIIGQFIPKGEVKVIDNLGEHADFFYNLHDINFIALAPLIVADGSNFGNIAVMGNRAIRFKERERLMLKRLAETVIGLLESRLINYEFESLTNDTRQINAAYKILNDDYKLLGNYNDHIAQANSTLEGVLDSYELLFKHAPVAIGICSYHDRVIWQANDALTNVFVEVSTPIGIPLDKLISHIDGQAASDVIGFLHADSDSYHKKGAKIKIQHSGGTKNIYVDLSLQFVGRMGDESQNIMFILADVTNQVVLNQITLEANTVLMNAIEDTGMGYTIVELATGKMTSNNQFKANYGYSSGEPFSYPDLFKAMLSDYRQIIKNAVSDAIMCNGIYQAEYEVKWRDGSAHRIRAYGKPMYDADGIATHIIGLNKIISGNR